MVSFFLAVYFAHTLGTKMVQVQDPGLHETGIHHNMRCLCWIMV